MRTVQGKLRVGGESVEASGHVSRLRPLRRPCEVSAPLPQPPTERGAVQARGGGRVPGQQGCGDPSALTDDHPRALEGQESAGWTHARVPRRGGVAVAVAAEERSLGWPGPGVGGELDSKRPPRAAEVGTLAALREQGCQERRCASERGFATAGSPWCWGACASPQANAPGLAWRAPPLPAIDRSHGVSFSCGFGASWEPLRAPSPTVPDAVSPTVRRSPRTATARLRGVPRVRRGR